MASAFAMPPILTFALTTSTCDGVPLNFVKFVQFYEMLKRKVFTHLCRFIYRSLVSYRKTSLTKCALAHKTRRIK